MNNSYLEVTSDGGDPDEFDEEESEEEGDRSGLVDDDMSGEC
jgi:hypothetical protein